MQHPPAANVPTLPTPMLPQTGCGSGGPPCLLAGAEGGRPALCAPALAVREGGGDGGRGCRSKTAGPSCASAHCSLHGAAAAARPSEVPPCPVLLSSYREYAAEVAQYGAAAVERAHLDATLAAALVNQVCYPGHARRWQVSASNPVC